MKTVCRECDHPNDLGRLFCTECGAKLDMNAVNEDIEAKQEATKRLMGLKLLLIPIVGVLIGLVGLCGWSGKPFVSENSSEGRKSTIDTLVWALSQITRRPAGSTITSPRPFRECDANDWLGHMAMQKPVNSMSVKIETGKVTFRVVDSVGPFSLMSGKLNIRALNFSYDVVAKPTDGKINVSMGRFGHCPLVGPLKRIVQAQAAKLLKDRALEKSIISYATNIDVEDDEISVTVTAPE